MRRRVKIWSIASAVMIPLVGVMAVSYLTLLSSVAPQIAMMSASEPSEMSLARKAPHYSAGSGASRIEPSAAPPKSDVNASLVLSLASSIVSTLGAISTMALAWRSDRRAVRELEAKLAKLEGEVA